MTVELRTPSREALFYIARNLRACDHAEIFALRWDDDPDAFAQHLCRIPQDLMFVAHVDNEPTSVIGAMPVWPRVWNVFAFGTNKWDNAAMTLTKHARRFLIPAVHHSGFHRAQAWSAASHTKAHAWMQRSLGARIEGTHRGFGRNGEDYHLLVWDRSDTTRIMEKDHVLRRQRARD